MTLWERIAAPLRGLLFGERAEGPPVHEEPPGPGVRPAFLEAAAPEPLPAPELSPDPPPERRAPAGVAGPDPKAGAAGPAPRRFVLSVDHAGQFLVTTGRRVSLGHLRSGLAHLPFLADVAARHAEIVRADSFREGPFFCLFPFPGERVEVGGRRVGEEGWRLQDGDLCRLGGNLSFRFRIPDPASQTALLELAEGVECGGARTVVLLGEGEGGRLRIGSASGRHVRVPGLEDEIEVLADPEEERLHVRSGQGVLGPLPGGAAPDGPDEVELELPPRERVDLSFPGSRRGGPPFGIAFSPPDLPSLAAARSEPALGD